MDIENSSLAVKYSDAAFCLDVSRAGIPAESLSGLADKLAAAHAAMGQIEAGAIKNADENRRVTHFTDRQAYADSATYAEIEAFFAAQRSAGLIDSVVINGIGGSALGPQLVQQALNGPYWNELSAAKRGSAARIYFTDNTDPAGVTDILDVVDLARTCVVTISKSGGTRETRNNMLVFEAAYSAAGIDFAKHACAVTMPGSKLDQYAEAGGWAARWPMAESIGGRTSETAVVGHVPAAAAGLDFKAMLDGALTMDEWTRSADVSDNPAYLLAAAWYLLGEGTGERNMVVVPYSDRLVLLAKYLQQLVMESLGKAVDRDFQLVEQGLTVYGNKGGTDAHAYVQQLQDGRNDFFITFIEVLEDAAQYDMETGLTMGDYLHNFMCGLRNALTSKGRSVIQITINAVSPRTLGMLIALYERAVAAYAELININAFHQPGVEAYKKASSDLDALSLKLQGIVAANAGFCGSATALADSARIFCPVAEVEGLLAKFAANGRSFGGVSVTREFVDGDWEYRFA
jgi:glucose-6-phosphate isomerase